MIHIENISSRDRDLLSGRRGFLKGMLGAGAFVLSIRLMPGQMFAASANGGASDAMTKAPLRPNVYLAIDTDGTAYIIAHRSEMGSGSRTALPRILADELDADWATKNTAIRIPTDRIRCEVSSTFCGSLAQPRG